MATSGPTGMNFIFTNGRGNAEPNTRKAIRRHVMLGKNKGKTRSGTRQSVPTEPVTTCAANTSNDPDEDSRLLMRMRYPSLPNKVGSELSLTRFAAAAEPRLIHDLLRFCFVAKRIMYPLERHVVFHKESKVDKSWLDFLALDAAYMHAAIFASQAYALQASSQKSSASTKSALVHYSTALRLLTERMTTLSDHSVSDATILAVLYLTLHAHFIGDHKTARKHMQGLCTIVDLRGGLSALGHNTKLVMELLKCDLGIALNEGSEALFSRHVVATHGPMMLNMKASRRLATKFPWEPDHQDLNDDLRQVWVYLKGFCVEFNTAAQRSGQLPQATLLHAMASVMYQLLRLTPFQEGSIDEVIRLGLLTFSSHIFLSWQGIERPRTHLQRTYRACLLQLSLPSGLAPKIVLWLLMIGSLAIFTPDDDVWVMPWVRATIEMCEVQHWNELYKQLKTLPWIEFVHDKPGLKVYNTALSYPRDSSDCN